MEALPWREHLAFIYGLEFLCLQLGKLSKELDFVHHSFRTKLDELKREELNRLRLLIKAKHDIQGGNGMLHTHATAVWLTTSGCWSCARNFVIPNSWWVRSHNFSTNSASSYQSSSCCYCWTKSQLRLILYSIILQWRIEEVSSLKRMKMVTYTIVATHIEPTFLEILLKNISVEV